MTSQHLIVRDDAVVAPLFDKEGVGEIFKEKSCLDFKRSMVALH